MSAMRLSLAALLGTTLLLVCGTAVCANNLVTVANNNCGGDPASSCAAAVRTSAEQTTQRQVDEDGVVVSAAAPTPVRGSALLVLSGLLAVGIIRRHPVAVGARAFFKSLLSPRSFGQRPWVSSAVLERENDAPLRH